MSGTDARRDSPSVIFERLAGLFKDVTGVHLQELRDNFIRMDGQALDAANSLVAAADIMISQAIRLRAQVGRHRNSLAAVQKLPAEVHQLIALSLGPTAAAYDGTPNTDILNLRLICTYWWHMIDGTPVLWTTVRTSFSRRFLELCLDRSKAAPLQVNLGYPLLHIDLLLLHAHRWQLVSLESSPVGIEEILSQPLPKLNSFEAFGSPRAQGEVQARLASAVSRFFTASPLRHLSIALDALLLLPAHVVTALQSLVVLVHNIANGPLESLMKQLVDCTRLRSLHLVFTFLEDAIDSESPIPAFDFRELQEFRLTGPASCLRFLRLVQPKRHIQLHVHTGSFITYPSHFEELNWDCTVVGPALVSAIQTWLAPQYSLSIKTSADHYYVSYPHDTIQFTRSGDIVPAVTLHIAYEDLEYEEGKDATDRLLSQLSPSSLPRLIVDDSLGSPLLHRIAAKPSSFADIRDITVLVKPGLDISWLRYDDQARARSYPQLESLCIVSTTTSIDIASKDESLAQEVLEVLHDRRSLHPLKKLVLVGGYYTEASRKEIQDLAPGAQFS